MYDEIEFKMLPKVIFDPITMNVVLDRKFRGERKIDKKGNEVYVPYFRKDVKEVYWEEEGEDEGNHAPDREVLEIVSDDEQYKQVR